MPAFQLPPSSRARHTADTPQMQCGVRIHLRTQNWLQPVRFGTC